MRTNQPHRNWAIDALFTLLLLAGSAKLPAQPVPHHFSGITVAPDQAATLSLDGSAAGLVNLTGTISNQFRLLSDLYPVETSTDLIDWTRLALLRRTNSDAAPLLFQDTHAAGASPRFYRTFTNHLLTAFPRPSGSFAVGTVDRVMMDPARTKRYRYSPPTNTFVVTFWYPADPPAAGTLPAPAWSQRFAADATFWSAYAAMYGFDSRWGLIAPKLVGQRFRGVPLAAGTNKFPVVLYAHGFQGTREASSEVAEELASHGYVVVATDHPDCWAAAFPDDGPYLLGSTSFEIPGRLADMEFLVGALTQLSSSDPLFAGRLDLDRIGVSGMSLGGMVVETCRSDRRVKCAAVWEGASMNLNGAGLQKPFLVAVAQSTSLYSDAQWLFSKAITNATFLQVKSTDHITGTDGGWTAELPSGRAPAVAINACFVWFFDTYLKGETPPFPTNPEIYNVMRK